MVIDERTTGTAEDAAAARARRMLDRSAHSTSKFSGLKMTRVPSPRSVALTEIRGPSRFRSLNVAPLNRISSYKFAASSERPQPLEPSEGQLNGFMAR